MAFDVYNRKNVSWGPLRRLELKTEMKLAFAHDKRELDYTEWLNELHQEIKNRYPPVFGMAYCYFDPPNDRVIFLEYSQLWRATIEFVFESQTDGWCFIGFHSRELYTGSSKERRRLYDAVHDW